jgi:hypothetical protein
MEQNQNLPGVRSWGRSPKVANPCLAGLGRVRRTISAVTVTPVARVTRHVATKVMAAVLPASIARV